MKIIFCKALLGFASILALATNLSVASQPSKPSQPTNDEYPQHNRKVRLLASPSCDVAPVVGCTRRG